ncbi:hypothetical protein llap_6357 [Limosa lapponica baueri]|uniref:Uncharacterized protein n=1 Tax=Limosa lapponica baueri TaxID=1758121 RepID=A0A2I0UBD3_LIMLA|nr:hypothetical protein llap_6357 [Limosa lapponica baueri]
MRPWLLISLDMPMVPCCPQSSIFLDLWFLPMSGNICHDGEKMAVTASLDHLQGKDSQEKERAAYTDISNLSTVDKKQILHLWLLKSNLTKIGVGLDDPYGYLPTQDIL